MEDLEIDCQVGHPSKVRASEPRKQKHDRRDAALLLKLQVGNRFPSILDAFDRAARFARVADAPPSMGTDADTGAERAASHCAQSRFAARRGLVGPSRPTRYRIVAASATYRISAY